MMVFVCQMLIDVQVDLSVIRAPAPTMPWRNHCGAVDVPSFTYVNPRTLMYRWILLAFDGSADGRDALVHAQNVAAACGSRVHLVAIVESPERMLAVEAGDRPS